MSPSEVLIAAINPEAWDKVTINELIESPVTGPSLPRTRKGQSRRRIGGVHEDATVLLDSFARILVSERKSETIALGAALLPRKITLFVASDENRNLSRMVEHLRALWVKLQEIRCDVLETGRGYDEALTNPARKFRELVYQYSWDKQWERYDEYSEALPDLRWLLQEVLSESPCAAKDPSKCDTDDEYGEYIPDDDIPLLMLLKEVLDLTENYNAEKSSTTLYDLASDIAILNHTLRITESEVLARLRAICKA